MFPLHRPLPTKTSSGVVEINREVHLFFSIVASGFVRHLASYLHYVIIWLVGLQAHIHNHLACRIAGA
jgi:hypothetical protein